MAILNSRSPLPLYHQLSRWLEQQIESGHFPAGSRIPSETRLAADFSIGRPTVRQAIDSLVRRGLLVRRRGSGTYVCRPRPEVDLFSLDGTSRSFQKAGRSVTTRLLAPTHLVTAADGKDNPFFGQPAFRIDRLTQVDSQPVLIEEIYLDPELFAGLDAMDLDGRSLSTLAETHFFIRPSGGRQSFQIGYPDKRQARHLEVTLSTPILVVQRWLHFESAGNALFAMLFCRTDRFVFSQTIGDDLP